MRGEINYYMHTYLIYNNSFAPCFIMYGYVGYQAFVHLSLVKAIYVSMCICMQ